MIRSRGRRCALRGDEQIRRVKIGMETTRDQHWRMKATPVHGELVAVDTGTLHVVDLESGQPSMNSIVSTRRRCVATRPRHDDELVVPEVECEAVGDARLVAQIALGTQRRGELLEQRRRSTRRIPGSDWTRPPIRARLRYRRGWPPRRRFDDLDRQRRTRGNVAPMTGRYGSARVAR